jgi:hypothetical protein
MIPLTGVAASALARLRTRAESFGPVDPCHYVFAAFVPKFNFKGTNVVGYNVTGYDPTKHSTAGGRRGGRSRRKRSCRDSGPMTSGIVR